MPQITAAPNAPALDQTGPQVYGIVVNGAEMSSGTTVIRQGNDVYVLRSDLESWNFLPPPKAAATTIEGQSYYELSKIPGVKYTIDAAHQAVVIQAPSKLFRTTVVDVRESASPVPQAPGTGGFLNYTLYGTSTGSGVRGDVQLGATLSDATVTTEYLSQGIGHGAVNRVGTAYRRDDLKNMTTLTIGDAVTGAGTLGLSSRFFGVNWASNFGIEPNFVPYAVPDLSGNSAVPSTVDVILNNATMAQQEVRPGPFSFQNLPLAVGANQVQLVVTDALGQQHIVTASYYRAPTLLEPGLTQFSYSGGFQRRNNGTLGGSYGSGFFEGTTRHGFNQHFTGEAHAELSLGREAVAGVSGSWLISRLGVVQLGIAGSAGKLGEGVRSALGYTYTSHRFSFGAADLYSSPSFQQVGNDTPFSRSSISGRNEFALSGSVRMSGVTELSLGDVYDSSTPYIVDPGSQRQSARALTGTITTVLAQTQINLSYLSSYGQVRSGSVFLSLARRVGKSDFAQEQTQSVRGVTTSQVQLTHEGPVQLNPYKDRLDYSIAASPNSQGYSSAAFVLNAPHFIAAVDGGVAQGQDFVDAGFQGGVAYIGHRFYLAQPFTQSYGLLEFGYPHVRVYSDGQWIGTTDKNGRVLIPNLMPYRDNAITVDERDLSLDVQAEKDVRVNPVNGGGAIVRMKSKVEHSALISLVDEKGNPIVAGVTLRNPKGRKGEVWPVADDGQAFIEPIEPGRMELLADAEGQPLCKASLVVPQNVKVDQDLGIVTCLPVARYSHK